MFQFPVNFLEVWMAIQGYVYFLLAIAVGDLIFGSYLAWVKGEFEWSRWFEWFQHNIMPIIGWMFWAFLNAFPAEMFPEELQISVPVVYAYFAGKVLASLIEHFVAMGWFPPVRGFTPTGIDLANDTGHGTGEG